MRFDAEFYKPEYIEVISRINNLSYVSTIGEITEEIDSGSYIDIYFSIGTLYLRVNNLRENGFDFHDVQYVNTVFSNIPSKIRVNTGELA
ncbi:MAG: hypothetical protein NC816_01570 [Candidatus Omnitrophica bacterium]|nr:hypothetical protein [Candidatus Omnitrophota bacterium]